MFATKHSQVLGLLLVFIIGLSILVFPVVARAGQTNQAECLFNWAETNYPGLFAPAGAATHIAADSVYRHYPATQAYLRVSTANNHLYYQGSDGAVQDEGPLADWLPKAGCQALPSLSECVFNWAETNYAALFAPSKPPTSNWNVYTYRYYSATNAYLAVSSADYDLYYQGPDGILQDEGPLSNWLVKGCHPPVANAGADQTAFVGTTATLDGSASSDPDGNAIAYQWTLLQQPADSQASLLNPTALHPTLAIDKPGTYKISLVVNDGQFDSAPAAITLSTQNSKPVANAGTAQTGKVGNTLVLDGSASRDADGDVLSYHWVLLTKPQNSGAALNNAESPSPRVTLDQPGNYTAQLTVNDGKSDSAPATVTLSTINSKPVAEAGLAQTITLSLPVSPVLLDGGGSTDADRDPLNFRWALIHQPTGSQSTLLDPLSQSARFTPDFIGDYVAQLIVNDGHAVSDPDTVAISVKAGPVKNHPPQITSTPVTKSTEGQAYSYQVTAADPENDTLAYSLTTSLKGMTINASTGLIQWTPGVNDLGSHPVTVNVDDGNGGNAIQNFNLLAALATNPVNVPTLTGLSRNAAETAIQQGQLNLGMTSFQHNNSLVEGLVIQQSPAANAIVSLGTPVNLTVSLGPDTGLPPNPATIAPAVDQTVATTVSASTKFLYSGANPIQTGVAPGTIEARRAAVIRGRVLTDGSLALPGVIVTILNHPELGQTKSRTDGAYDLAVNGGGQLTVVFNKDGYLTAQRNVLNVPWQGYAIVEDALLIAKDSKVTTLDLNSPEPMKVAQGSVVVDSDGQRQATLMIPQGVTVQVYNPDGTTRTVSQLNFRATEYTVGPDGPKKMPGPLPPTSGYTYAVELSADEAPIKIAGKDVLFSQPVPFYVDNFLNMPVGIQVPVAYWDKTKNAWIPSDDGKIIKILSVTNGLADIDADGDGSADDATKLSALSITAAEREKLAGYPVGKTLWRALLAHLSTYDCNYGVSPPPGATPPNQPPPQTPANNNPNNPDTSCGSIIECQNQTLGETLPITGTGLSLNYRSDRMPGIKDVYSMTIRLPSVLGNVIPNRIELEVAIAGKTFKKEFPPNPFQTYVYTWDGLDVFGRQVRGQQTAKVTTSFVYDGFYNMPSSMSRSFGAASGERIPGNIPARTEARFTDNSQAVLGPATSASELGGWLLSAHHNYDPMGKVLYMGDGRRRSANGVASSIITTVAGGGNISCHNLTNPLLCNGMPATNVSIYEPSSIAMESDGSFSISASGGQGGQDLSA